MISRRMFGGTLLGGLVTAIFSSFTTLEAEKEEPEYPKIIMFRDVPSGYLDRYDVSHKVDSAEEEYQIRASYARLRHKQWPLQ